MRTFKHYVTVLFMLLCSVAVSAHDFEIGGIFYKITSMTDLTVEVTYDAAEFINNMDYSGTYSLLAYGPDSLTAMVITLYAYSEEEIACTFVNDGKFGLFGEGQYEFDGANTSYGVYNADFETYDLVYAEKGEVVVTVDEEKNITLTGYVICENAVQYNVTVKSKIQRPRLDYDTPDTPVDRVFTAQDEVFIHEEGDLIYFSVQSIEHGDVFDFYMIVEAADPDIVLPVGMYEINDSGEYNTVLAGQGVEVEREERECEIFELEVEKISENPGQCEKICKAEIQGLTEWAFGYRSADQCFDDIGRMEQQSLWSEIRHFERIWIKTLLFFALRCLHCELF